MIEMEVSGHGIYCSVPEPIMYGATPPGVQFTFDEDWDDTATRVAVFQCEGVKASVTLSSENTCDIPSDVIKKNGAILVGVVGKDEDETVTLNTVYGLLGFVSNNRRWPSN